MQLQGCFEVLIGLFSSVVLGLFWGYFTVVIGIFEGYSNVIVG